MGKEFAEIDARIQQWIERQKMFFVATAPLAADGLINCSPKGLDTLCVLGPKQLAYLDVGGSGAKAAARSFVPVVGQVNMDQITVDLTDVAPPGGRRRPALGPGTEVELIGADPKAPNHLTTLAAVAGTIPHDVLCRLNPRIRRMYHATERYEVETVAARRPARKPVRA